MRDLYHDARRGGPPSLIIGDESLAALFQSPGSDADWLTAFIALLEREAVSQGVKFDPRRPIHFGSMGDSYWFNNERGGQTADEVWRRIAAEMRTV